MYFYKLFYIKYTYYIYLLLHMQLGEYRLKKKKLTKLYKLKRIKK